MKKIGIVGGIAWRSTADYYAGLCRRGETYSRARNPCATPRLPKIVIESLDIGKAIADLGTDGNEPSWRRFDEYHRAALRRLETAGADFALMASNTPHHRFEPITAGIGIPVINLYEVAACECARIHASRVLILGTAATMASSILRRVFAARSIETVGPRSEWSRRQLEELIEELQRGGVTALRGVWNGLFGRSWNRYRVPHRLFAWRVRSCRWRLPDGFRTRPSRLETSVTSTHWLHT